MISTFTGGLRRCGVWLEEPQTKSEVIGHEQNDGV